MTSHTTDPLATTDPTSGDAGHPDPERRDHNLWPGVTCADALAVRRWLAVLGFDEGVCILEDDGHRVMHSEMLWPERGRVMVSSSERSDPSFAVPVGGGSCYVVCDDSDAVFARATAIGARVVRPLEDTDYGSRGFSIADDEGNRWSFGTYAGQPPR